jgi:O-antigen/teichoic acid export membrane protein
MPRFSKLSAENKHGEIITLYRTATRFIGAVTIPATLALAFFAEPILFAWTGDAQIAAKTAPVLTLYSLGNGILVFNAFPYYLQYATGDLKLHFFGSILFILLFLPTLIFLTLKLGIIGAGWSWFSINLVSFVLWISFLHHYLCPGLHLKWLFNDIGISLLYCTPFAITLNYFIKWNFSRVHTGLAILLICLTLIMSTLIPLLFSRYIKNTAAREQLKKFFGTTL